ncbi:vWA domain-containing protein [Sinanaerobacter chloroacetimidivorans]|uniref:VWA domain-containing protein n=1 Tax=Sinanaerobacter chloroacetimidivorans TaxID=2818044 RepID=A0A8J7W5F8_9FIRM|nr:VWA domain-containing protein [Sinanaerobacter chloroacetimidivorans]MBR0599448.1 VWA domain-containing protein [Sinanaerobacter chloroacetimidivorans]
MFISFFYLLRARGLKVSLNEWLSLTEALDKGLCRACLLDFYHLCRSILVKSEGDYDKFDMAFAEYFKGIKTPEDIPEEIWKWLNEDVRTRDINDKNMLDDYVLELEELQKRLQERIAEQKEKHDGGNYWIGTGGTSTMGYNGYHERGIRVGGEGRHKNAVQVAGERHFKDFRQDNILDTRQFQMAFRKLRQFSSRLDGAKTELDIDGTIDETCENAGNLKLVWAPPRKNTVKLLLLFDSDGSMMPYSRLCSQLFQAVSKSNHFKDLKVYYFHNCIYEHLYTDPHCRRGEWVNTEYVLSNLSSEYKVIFVGDGTMAPSELMSKGGNCYVGLYNEIPGIDWLRRFKNKYPKHIWLNPIPESEWEYTYGSRTILKIKELFPMFELTLDGLEAGIKKLLVSK